jgi:hypothetical protein
MKHRVKEKMVFNSKSKEIKKEGPLKSADVFLRDRDMDDGFDSSDSIDPALAS